MNTPQFSNGFKTAISLGVDCRVRYQLSRHLYEQLPAEQRVEPFAKVLHTNSRATTPEGTYFFDWLVTPSESVMAVLKNRFEGIFARENVTVHKNGSAIDSRYGIVFQHSFSRDKGRVTEAIIEKEFEQEREKVLYLAKKTLSAMTSTDDVLYIVAVMNTEKLKIISDIITDLSGKRHHLIGIKGDDVTGGYIETHPNRSLYSMTRKVDKSPGAQWEGDDREWSAFLKTLPLNVKSAF